MTQINTYKQAEDFFAKCRNKDAGRPLGPTGWRLHRTDDTYVITYCASKIATIHPDNRLVLTGCVANGVSIAIQKVLPIAVVRRSEGHYRAHIRKSDKSSVAYLSSYGLTEWKEWQTKGMRYMPGITIDLTTRTPLDYVEPVRTVDPDARKQWLRDSDRVKKHLKTIAKLGGFVRMIEALEEPRWMYCAISCKDDADLKIMLEALEGGDMLLLAQRVAEHMKRVTYQSMPDTDLQLDIIDGIFANNSLTLRRALGVITSEV